MPDSAYPHTWRWRADWIQCRRNGSGCRSSSPRHPSRSSGQATLFAPMYCQTHCAFHHRWDSHDTQHISHLAGQRSTAPHERHNLRVQEAKSKRAQSSAHSFHFELHDEVIAARIIAIAIEHLTRKIHDRRSAGSADGELITIGNRKLRRDKNGDHRGLHGAHLDLQYWNDDFVAVIEALIAAATHQ